MEHPAGGPAAAFLPILAAIQDGPRIAREAQMQAYVTLLKQHDWSFAYSDDGRVYRAGRAERDTLNALQREIDLQGAVWNQHAPAEYAIQVADFTPATDAQQWRLPA